MEPALDPFLRVPSYSAGVNVVLAFDSFKGCLSAPSACEAVREGIRSARPGAEVSLCPLADGGEGTAAVLIKALGGEWIPMAVSGPLGHPVAAGYGWVETGRVAIVEMAAASGLTLLDPRERDPLRATTFGTGELILAAADRGARKILLTVGGSATVDGGVGAAEALGWSIDVEAGRLNAPTGLVLPDLEVLCDVDNPLCGPHGAARVYAPQKGATAAQVELLERRLARLAECVREELGIDAAGRPGAGAAGGLAFGAAAFLGGRLVSGADAVMRAVGYREAVGGADWVLTGEGSFDAQSLRGKAVSGAVREARRAGVRVGVIAGRVGLPEDAWRAAGIAWVRAMQREGVDEAESMRRARERLADAGAAFAREFATRA
jgi:glycerate 2-kinase